MDGEDEGLLTGLRGYKKGWGENYILCNDTPISNITN